MAKKKKGNYYKKQLVCGLVMGVFTIAFAAIWIYVTRNISDNKKEFMKNAEKTTAVITNIETSIDGDEIKRVDIRYIVDNVQYTGVLKEINTNMYEGMVLDIYYNLSNPKDFIQYSDIDFMVLNSFAFFIVLIGIIQLICFIRKLILYVSTVNGREVNADVVNVIKGSYFGQKYFKIQCEWKDEKGILHTFFSERFTEPYFEKEFEKMNIKTLVVRIKQNAPSKYIVLTDRIHKKLNI